ncbi:MAG: hypothetical protein ACTSV5_14565 [Promethearchaeota archaeon]
MSDIEKEIMNEVRDFVRALLKKYWYILVVVLMGVVGAFIGGVTVELLFIETSEIGGYGTWNLGQFSVGSSILFILLSIGWLLLLVGLPLVGYFAIIGCIFWFVIISEDNKAYIKEKMKDEERKEKKKAHRKKQAKKGGGGGGISFFTVLIMLLVIFVQGNWWVTFGNLSFTYFLFLYIEIIIWCAAIFGIGGLIVFILWLTGVIGK